MFRIKVVRKTPNNKKPSSNTEKVFNIGVSSRATPVQWPLAEFREGFWTALLSFLVGLPGYGRTKELNFLALWFWETHDLKISHTYGNCLFTLLLHSLCLQMVKLIAKMLCLLLKTVGFNRFYMFSSRTSVRDRRNEHISPSSICVAPFFSPAFPWPSVFASGNIFPPENGILSDREGRWMLSL